MAKINRHSFYRQLLPGILRLCFTAAVVVAPSVVDAARPGHSGLIPATVLMRSNTRKLAEVPQNPEQVASSSASETPESCSITFDPTFTAADFPTNFDFGVATAAYQIEGAVSEEGRGPSIWDKFTSLPGKIENGDNATVADNSYHLYEEDVKLLQAMGVSTYRFSIAWPRLLPEGRGAVNPLGIEYYNKLIDALLAAGIQPAVTLYHWDLPLALHESMGGWLNESIGESFVEFADLCFRTYGDRVKTWITFNEPGHVASGGYASGSMAPGRCSNHTRCQEGGNSSTEPYVVGHNMLRAHAAAAKLYRNNYQTTQGGRIGITLDCSFPFPASDSTQDMAASERALQFSFGWWADPVFKGDYPAVMKELVGARLPTFTVDEQHDLRGSADFVGVNSYTGSFVTQGSPPEPGAAMPSTDSQVALSFANPSTGNAIGESTSLHWLFVVPEAIYHVTTWVSQRYVNIPILVTENGVSDAGDKPLPSALCDQQRIAFHQAYLKQLLRAIHAGAQIEAYYAWSLLDNFEWARGYGQRFGLHWVDYTDPRRPRIPKMSARWWSYFLKTP